MQIYENLKDDATASVTLQMSAAEFNGIRQYMHTPEQFSNVKLLNGVYLNKIGFGWYRLSPSNDFMVVRKFETALILIRKIDRTLRGLAEKEAPCSPRRLGVPFERHSSTAHCR